MLLLLILSIALASNDLDYFIDKEIRIFLSEANHIFLGFKENDSFLSAQSKYSNLKGFNTLSRIFKDGDLYRIKVGSEYLCFNSDRAVKCGLNHKWQIIERPFGYSFKQNSKCLTLFSKTYLKMMSCTDSNDQIFDMKYANEDQICGSSFDSKLDEPKKENVFIFNIDKNMLNNNYDSISEDSHSHSNHRRNDFVDLTNH